MVTQNTHLMARPLRESPPVWGLSLSIRGINRILIL